MLVKNILRKIRKTDAKTLVFVGGDVDGQTVDLTAASSKSVAQMLDELHYDRVNALDGNKNMLWSIDRDDVESDSDGDDDDVSYDVSADESVPAPVDNQMPERFLRLMIMAQESATKGMRQAIETLADAIQIQHERNQMLLDRYAEMVTQQREEIERLISEKQEALESDDDNGKLIAQVAPIVAPIIEKIATERAGAQK